MYRIILLSDAEKSFGKLDQPTQKKIAQKIDWLAENADKVIHHPFTSLPDDLRGLCRLSLGIIGYFIGSMQSLKSLRSMK